MGTRETVLKALNSTAKEPIPSDDDASLFECGAIDSFGLLDLIAALEGEFGVKVPDADLTPRRFSSVSKITAYFDQVPGKQKRAGG